MSMLASCSSCLESRGGCIQPAPVQSARSPVFEMLKSTKSPQSSRCNRHRCYGCSTNAFLSATRCCHFRRVHTVKSSHTALIVQPFLTRTTILANLSSFYMVTCTVCKPTIPSANILLRQIGTLISCGTVRSLRHSFM